nr:MAG TPA_asm: hypothetical protein [Caudoviricetes sp.]
MGGLKKRDCCLNCTDRAVCHEMCVRYMGIAAAEIEAQRRANVGHRVMVEKLRQELQKSDEKYKEIRRRTLWEIQKLLEKEEGE